MDQTKQDIEDLDRHATKCERVAQRTPHYETWLKNELHAAELRRRIEVLRQRLAKLPHVRPEK